MSKDLSKVHNKLLKTIQANFPKSVEIEAIVDSVNNDTHFFTVRTLDNSKTLKCRTNEYCDITKLKNDDVVTIKGLMQLDPNNTGEIYFSVQCIDISSEKDKYSDAINMYNRLFTTLNSDKCKAIIQKINPKNPPIMVENIGLIVMPDNEQNIDNFKIAFQEKCVGQLFIFRLKNENIYSHLRSAFEYFKKYHNINLICMLTNQLSTNIICGLSSKDNVRYMLNRKNVPYVVSIISTSPENTTMQPLSVMLSNKKIEGINSCIDFIHDIQLSFRKQIDHGIKQGTDILEKVIEKQKKKLFDLKMHVAELSDYRFIPRSTDSPPERLKDLLEKRLSYQRIILNAIQTGIMKIIINDPRLQKIYLAIIESEREIKNNSKNGISDELSSNRKNVKQDGLKQLVLPQNQILKEHSENTSQIKKPTETTITDIMNQTKKIENKTADNSSLDILSINIQRNNGDF
jgi:hypothetical protein